MSHGQDVISERGEQITRQLGLLVTRKDDEVFTPMATSSLLNKKEKEKKRNNFFNFCILTYRILVIYHGCGFTLFTHPSLFKVGLLCGPSYGQGNFSLHEPEQTNGCYPPLIVLTKFSLFVRLDFSKILSIIIIIILIIIIPTHT